MKHTIRHGRALYYEADCFDWLRERRPNSVHGVVTDPPFGLEYSQRELELRRDRGNNGGVWRLPPSFDGWERAPLPRFTVLSQKEIARISSFYFDWGEALLRVLVPGSHVLVASSVMLSHVLGTAVEAAGFERRGYVVRLVHTMRGGDRPKGAHEEFPEVSVLPRAMHEPWVLFRKPLDGRIQDNLRTWGTGGLRRPDPSLPFPDVIRSGRTAKRERDIAPHPNLKPQLFLRQVVRAILPLGEGVLLDTFAGSGSTLAAAQAVGYRSIGVERDPVCTSIARTAIPELARITVSEPQRAIAETEAATKRRSPRPDSAADEQSAGDGRGNGAVPKHRILAGYDDVEQNGKREETAMPPRASNSPAEAIRSAASDENLAGAS